MGDDNRQRILFFRTDVNEMDVQPVDIRDELRIAFELRLDLAPVVLLHPIAGDLLHRRERHALLEIGDGLPFGPARRENPLTKVVKFLFRNVNVEVADCDLFPNLLGHGALLSLNRPSLVTIAAHPKGAKGLTHDPNVLFSTKFVLFNTKLH